MIKNMEMVNINIQIKQSTMGNGKKTLEKAMEHITIQMEIVMRETGTLIFKVELELITTLMVTFTKGNG